MLPDILSRSPDIEDGEPGVNKLQKEGSVHPVWPVAKFTNVPQGGDSRRIGSSEHQANALSLQLGRVENFQTELVCRPQQALVLSEEPLQMVQIGSDGLIVLPNLKQ